LAPPTRIVVLHNTTPFWRLLRAHSCLLVVLLWPGPKLPRWTRPTLKQDSPPCLEQRSSGAMSQEQETTTTLYGQCGVYLFIYLLVVVFLFSNTSEHFSLFFYN